MKKINTDSVKGFKDISGKASEKRAVIREAIRRTFEKYNYEQAETPLVEYEDFVKSGNTGDDTISDVFKLKDKGGRRLALRYEFTFQLKRLAKNKKLPYKRFQIGPVFRDEPIQGNRLRQFTQCDVDVVGSTTKDEAEVLAIAKDIFDALKVKFKVYINNRKLLNEILDELEVKDSDKDQVIREIDKLDKLPEKVVRANLKKFKAERILSIIKKPESYFKKYVFYAEVEQLKTFCKFYGLEIVFLPSLARGLSYYNGSVFEIKSDIKESICAGGSYLVDNIQSTGISFGLERLELVTNLMVRIDKILIVSLDEDKKAIELSKRLRAQNKNVSIFYGRPSKALEYANAYRIKQVIFVGKKETKQKRFMIKDMQTGRQRVLVMSKSVKRIVRKR